MAGNGPFKLPLEAYVHRAYDSFERLVPLMPLEEQQEPGGFFALADLEGQVRLLFQVGNPPAEKLEGRARRAVEKCFRTAMRDEQSSWMSRVPERDRWGGALRLDLSGGFAGFSGFTEEFDELMSADVCVPLGDMSREFAFRNLMHHNPDFRRIRHMLEWAK